MSIKFLKLKNFLWLTLLSALGLSSCHSSKKAMEQTEPANRGPHDRNEIRLMYGVPTTDYAPRFRDDEDSIISDERDTITGQEKIGINDTAKNSIIQPADPRDDDRNIAMYGVPTVEFTIKGRVTDDDGKPLPGIQVIPVSSNIDPEDILKNPDGYADYIQRNADTTDKEGSFNCQSEDNPWNNQILLVRDVDGPIQGTYENRMVEVDFNEDTPNSAGVNSYSQRNPARDVTVKMKKKK
jgi:putative lipoprotein (rSAM/lipoprotein system)